ncbi:MAG TPA: cation:proton antiporter [Kiritimatiellia bacterium]|nr:cation:proton antiporter [Kiritimatiellia bacterium]
MPQLIQDIGICVITAWLLGLLAHAVRQPPLLAYLLGGFVVGPACLNLVSDPRAIGLISELGLLFLLFMIGLEIDLKKIASAGKSITVTSSVQILGGLLLGIAVFWAVGFPLGRDGRWAALYLAVATACSCTVVIVKLLYDRRELDTLAGRITLGIVVLQDLFSILFLAVQPNLNDLKVSVLLLSLLRVVVLVATALAVARYILPAIFRRVARLPELMLVGALAWCFMIGELAAQLQLSRAMGALIAGVALSTFPYALDVGAKVTSLRDFFVTLFFLGLGLAIPLPTWSVIGLAAGVAVFTVASRLVTTFTPLYLMRTGLRISLLPGINLAQISEFSLVILALGVQAGHIGADTSAAVSLAFVVLAVLSSLAISNSDPLVRRLIPVLKRAGLKDLDAGATAAPEATAGAGSAGRILIVGFFREASSLLEELTQHAPHLLPRVSVVDFNPVVFEELRKRGVHIVYGDVSQRDTLLKAGAADAALFICTVPESLLKGITNEKLVRQLREINPSARIIITTELLSEVKRLRAAGATYVYLPRLEEARDLSEAVRAALEGLLDQKQAEIDRQLDGRREVLP